MAYVDAIKANVGLRQVRAQVNLFGIDVGAPALASNNRFVTTTNMIVGAYTVANAASADGLPRNVTVTATAVTGSDTVGTITVTGTNAAGAVISEAIIPAQGSTVAGVKAFATVTGVVGAGWVINTGNDTIVVGTGNLVGLPAATITGPNPIDNTSDVFAVLVAGLTIAPVVVINATNIENCTIDASSATYDGAKRVVALCLRDATV